MIDRPRLRAALAATGALAVLASGLLFLAPDAVGGLAPVEALARSTALSEDGARAFLFGLVGVGCLLWVVATPEAGTDDRVAAAYLAGDEATSLARRLRSRLRPRKTRRRRVERTVRAIEALLDDRGRR